MKCIDSLELPLTPNFLRFRGKSAWCFPIRELPNSEIKLLFKRMADKVISDKIAAQKKRGAKEIVCPPKTVFNLSSSI